VQYTDAKILGEEKVTTEYHCEALTVHLRMAELEVTSRTCSPSGLSGCPGEVVAMHSPEAAPNYRL